MNGNLISKLIQSFIWLLIISDWNNLEVCWWRRKLNNGKYNVTLIHTVKKTQVSNTRLHWCPIITKTVSHVPLLPKAEVENINVRTLYGCNWCWLASFVLECHAVLFSDLSQSRILAINSIGVTEPEPERDPRPRRRCRPRGRSYLKMVTGVIVWTPVMGTEHWPPWQTVPSRRQKFLLLENEPKMGC